MINNATSVSWTGLSDTDWNTPNNWDPVALPTSATDVTIPSGLTNYPVIAADETADCNNIAIANGATLTIKSDATGTGSLIVHGTPSGAGLASVQRYMTTDAWHLVSSPLKPATGKTIGDFLKANDNVGFDHIDDATYDKAYIEDPARIRGMMDYNPTTNDWNDYFTNSNDGILETSKGFCLRSDASSFITFTGTLQTGAQPATGLTSGAWNCVGNPYTSAIRIVDVSNTSTINNFLSVNSANIELETSVLDGSYCAIYVWEEGNADYTAISKAYHPYDCVQQGQAFMVKMDAATTANSVSFTPAMQTADAALELKSAENVWPTIQLEASVGDLRSSTVIAFNSNMTKGLDPSYDAGLFKGASDLVLYSKLVEDNGIPFAIQALPDNDYNNLIVPVGLDFGAGGLVTFSAKTMNLPSDCQVILEDQSTHTFTDLSINTYQVTVAANSSISSRFRIHTSYLSTGLSKETLENQLSAYAYRNVEIRVNGPVSKQAVATLYDLQGRVKCQKCSIFAVCTR